MTSKIHAQKKTKNKTKQRTNQKQKTKNIQNSLKMRNTDGSGYHKQIVGVVLLPSNAKKPYFLQLKWKEIKTFIKSRNTPKERGGTDEGTKEEKGFSPSRPVSAEDKCQFLLRFLKSKCIKKICYNIQQCVKPFLAMDYPCMSS